MSWLPLQDGGHYRNGWGDTVTIAGPVSRTIGEDSSDWVYSTNGNWYTRSTGQYVGYGPAWGRGPGHFVLEEGKARNLVGSADNFPIVSHS